MKKASEQGLEATNQIMKSVISQFQIEGDLNQIKIQIHPIISNAMFARDNELLEAERFRTIQHLSRVFSDEDMERVVKCLGLHLTIA
jgi:hypothetical protein